MKVALCCIGRLENQYAVEYVEHYKSIGFNKIFIYDNNHDGEEHFEDVLQSYIDDGFVTVIDYRNKEAAQLSAYNDCYSKYGNEYDWIAFFDFDEFLILTESKDINEYLRDFENYDVVKINWMLYTDNGLVTNDGRPVLTRFTTPIDYNKCFSYNFPENNHVKSIVRGKIPNFRWNGTPHVPVMNLRYASSVCAPSDCSPFQKYDFSRAYIKHFSMKTIDEYFNKKRIRGQADRCYSTFEKQYKIDYFFKLNEKTEEKLNYIKNILNE